MDVERAVRERRSLQGFDPDHVLDDATLARLFALAVRAPSSFNLQHWRFVVVRDAGRRARLMEASFGQPQVGQAAAVVAVLGKLTAHEDAARIHAGLPPERRARLVSMIEAAYAADPQLQRDEALRSGSLAAMILMLAAQSMGLGSCPMIGFSEPRVRAILEAPADHLIVMLVALGKPPRVPAPPTERLPLEEVVFLERFSGAPLRG